MVRASLLALLFALAPTPGPVAFRAVSMQAEPALVRLVGGQGHIASGVIVGSGGEVVTLASVGEPGPVVAVGADGTPVNAEIVRRDTTLGLALVRLPPGRHTAAPAAWTLALRRGTWVVAVALGERGVVPAAGLFQGADRRHPGRVLADTPSLPGAGLFTLDGELVGIALGPAPGHRMRIVPIDAIRSWLQQKGTAP